MIRFAVLTDIQYGNLDPAGKRAYRESISKFLLAVGEMVAEKAAFVLQLGDASQSGWENHTAIKELFDVAENAGVAWKHVLGNHDFLVDDDRKGTLFTDFGLKKPGYYDFLIEDHQASNNNWRFVVLNGNEISSYASENDTEREIAQKERERWRLADGSLPQDWNGSLSTDQLRWLDETLTKAEKQNEKVLICSHFPLFANSKSIKNTGAGVGSILNLDLYYSRLGISTWNGDEVLTILDKHPCIKGYLAGHLHEGSYGVRKNVMHMTFKGIVENSPYVSSFVELTPNSIVVDGRGNQPSYKFNFE